MEYKIYKFIQSIHHYQDLGGIDNIKIPKQLQKSGEQILNYLETSHPCVNFPNYRLNIKKETNNYLVKIIEHSKNLWYTQAINIALELRKEYGQSNNRFDQLQQVLQLVAPKLRWKFGDPINKAIQLAKILLPKVLEATQGEVDQLIQDSQKNIPNNQANLPTTTTIPPLLPQEEIDRIRAIRDQSQDFQGEGKLYNNLLPPINAQGTLDPLSNFYGHKIIYKECSHRSTEHAYQHEKALFINDQETARAIKMTKSSKKVKQMGNDLNKKMSVQTKNRWDKIKLGLMEELLEIKTKVCHIFKQKLIKTWPHPLTHNAPDKFWGSYYYNKREKTPGQDKFVNCLLKIRHELKFPKTNKQNKRKNQAGSPTGDQNNQAEENPPMPQRNHNHPEPLDLSKQSDTAHSISDLSTPPPRITPDHHNSPPQHVETPKTDPDTTLNDTLQPTGEPNTPQHTQPTSTPSSEPKNTQLNISESTISDSLIFQTAKSPSLQLDVSDESLLRAVTSQDDTSGDISNTQLDQIIQSPPQTTQPEPAHLPIIGPHCHNHPSADKTSWAIPKFSEKLIILGDSNIKTITKAPTSTKSIETHAFPGAKLSHFTEMFKKDKQPHPNTTTVITSVGINNKTTTQRINKTQLEAFLSQYKNWQPQLKKAITVIPYHQSLKEKEATTLQKLNEEIKKEAKKHNIDVLPTIPQREFKVTTDKIHWTNNTGNQLLSAWVHHLNYLISSPHTPHQ